MKKSAGALAVVLLLTLSFFGFQSYKEYQSLSSMSNKVREMFATQFTPLPAPPFKKALGYVPSESEIELGRLLFNDPILSRNNDVSCATCHMANHGFADGKSLPIGALGHGGAHSGNVGKTFATGKLNNLRGFGNDGFGFEGDREMFRNSPSLINTVYRANKSADSGLLWDGRFGDLSFQTLLPIHTLEEMCGTNPLPLTEKDNIFRPGGPLFSTPVHLNHVNMADGYSGRDLNRFNAIATNVDGVKSIRPNGQPTTPNRNECLAIAIAKLRLIPEYTTRFKQVYNQDLKDLLVGRALASYVSSIVASNAPIDKFIAGENTLSPKQLRGLIIFASKAGELTNMQSKTLKGAGCISCHAIPTFGGEKFAKLGVISDPRSATTRPQSISVGGASGFFIKTVQQRGVLPNCHFSAGSISTVSKSGGYAPDIGRSVKSRKLGDCFSFRVPSLRNVIETFPYFHHGSARGQNTQSTSFQEQSLSALRQAIEYHTRGPISETQKNAFNSSKKYFDNLYQKDPLVPVTAQDFFPEWPAGEPFKSLELSEENLDDLVEFVAYSLWDKTATQEGVFGVDVGHPKEVPSGLSPALTRDDGHQRELAPAMVIKQ